MKIKPIRLDDEEMYQLIKTGKHYVTVYLPDIEAKEVRLEPCKRGSIEYTNIYIDGQENIDRFLSIGSIGSRFWVQEGYRINKVDHDQRFAEIEYRTDSTVHRYILSDPISEFCDGKNGAWRPSTQLPRWASRAMIEIESMRVANTAPVEIVISMRMI